MTDQPTTNGAPRSRRSLLAAAAAAGVGAIAASLPSPEVANAADGQTITVGGGFTGTSATHLNITGASALYVVSDVGIALAATSTSGLAAVSGNNTSGMGVSGESLTDAGVQGQSDTGAGVYGSAGAGAGVHGSANTGTGVIADSTYGTALQVIGRSRFSRSGRKAIAAGHSSVKVPMLGVTTSSYVVATLQTHRTGVYVAAAVPAAGSLTIYLNRAVTATTYVGFLVIN